MTNNVMEIYEYLTVDFATFLECYNFVKRISGAVDECIYNILWQAGLIHTKLGVDFSDSVTIAVSEWKREQKNVSCSM